MKHSLLALGLIAALCGCHNETNKKIEKKEASSASADASVGNKGQMEIDREITESIRETLGKEEKLSSAGKGIRILTIQGVVTLKGPVESIDEREIVEKIAKGVKNVKIVDNQLEISPSAKSGGNGKASATPK